MKLLKFLLLSNVLISLSIQVPGQPIDIRTAKIIARNHLLSVESNHLKSAKANTFPIRFTSYSARVEHNDTLYYVLNDSINHNFVIVSADKRVNPVIGYSLGTSYNEHNQPSAFKSWMESWKQEISSIKSGNLQPDSTTTAMWDNLMDADQVSDVEFAEPLLSTQWGQGKYYNFECPYDYQAFSYTLTGCVATAMAQVMKYWNFPDVGKGQHSYYSNYGTLSVDFGSTTYRWDKMVNDLVSANDAVATLMYHCGVAVSMVYGVKESGANQPRDAFVNYFRYSPDAQFVYQKNFSKTDWANLIKAEIDARRPVWYQGPGTEGEPHAFVCDGYQNSDLFHINWGWDGSYNGYYSLVTESNSGIITGLSPGNDGFDGFFIPADTLYTGTNGGVASFNIFSAVNWEAASDQTWLTLNLNSGSTGTSTLNFTAAENTSGSDRFAAVTVSAPGHSDQQITIIQPARVSVTPGELVNVINGLTAPVTSLTLTGSIDVRDFITMRDRMPDLTEVDLSDATVVEYVGKDGTWELNMNSAYPANTVPYKAFCGNQKIKNIILSASIIKVDNNAFADCSALSSVTIPSPEAKIGGYVFEDCFNLTSFTIPSSNTTVGNNIFYRCRKLNSIGIPASATTIEDNAFFSCSALTSVSIPATVTSIGDYAFFGSNGLNSIYAFPVVPVDLSSSGEVFTKVDKTATILYVPFGAKATYQEANQWKDFMNITEMPGLFLSGKLLTMSSTADTISYSLASSSDWTITSDQAWLTIDKLSGTSGSHSIAITASANSTGAIRDASITVKANGFDSQIVSIKQYSELEVTAGNLSAILGESLSAITSLSLRGTIDARDFKTMRDKMPALTDIDLSSVAIVEYTGSEGTKSSAGITFPANEIPEEGLRAKTGLKSIVIPPTTTSIATKAFYYCKELSRIEIPASVTFIGKTVFSISSAYFDVHPDNPNYSGVGGILFTKDKTVLIQCPTVLSGDYSIPQTVISIEERAFNSCAGLTTVTIPSSVTSIGASAFSSCEGLKAIHANSVSPVDLSNLKSVFYGVNKYTCILYVPVGSKGAYQSSDQWKDFTKIVEESVTTSNDIISNSNNLQFEVYPNPTDSKIKFLYNGILSGTEEVIITDINGKIICEEKLKSAETEFDLSGNSPGVYFIRINTYPKSVGKIMLVY